MQDLSEEFHLKTPLVLGVCLNLVARTTPSKANRINNWRLSCRKMRAVACLQNRKKKIWVIMEWKPWINVGIGKCSSSQLLNTWWGVRVKKGKGGRNCGSRDETESCDAFCRGRVPKGALRKV